jgi:cell division protein FtsI/penicillin-binding protein 2
METFNFLRIKLQKKTVWALSQRILQMKLSDWNCKIIITFWMIQNLWIVKVLTTLLMKNLIIVILSYFNKKILVFKINNFRIHIFKIQKIILIKHWIINRIWINVLKIPKYSCNQNFYKVNKIKMKIETLRNASKR